MKKLQVSIVVGDQIDEFDQSLKKIVVKNKTDGTVINSFFGMDSWVENVKISDLQIIEHILNTVLETIYLEFESEMENLHYDDNHRG